MSAITKGLKSNKMQKYFQMEGLRKITRLKGGLMQNLIVGFFIVLFFLPVGPVMY